MFQNYRYAFSLILVASSITVSAADMPKEGKMDFNYCTAAAYKPVMASPKLNSGLAESWASIYANPPGGPFDNQGSQCAAILVSRDGAMESTGYCKQIDKDGDMWLFKFTDRDFVGKLEVVGGTGKYDGMTMTADFKPLGGSAPSAAPGMVQTCNRVVGVYKLR